MQIYHNPSAMVHLFPSLMAYDLPSPRGFLLPFFAMLHEYTLLPGFVLVSCNEVVTAFP